MIKEFSKKDEYLKNIHKLNVKFLGQATEGSCYYASDGYVYKVYDVEDLNRPVYNLENIVTTNDIQLDSFAFPEELFMADNKLIGCKMKFAGNDLLKDYNLADLEAISVINFNKFKKAYYKMLKDVYTLSNNNIELYDLPFNIVFDGKKLTGVDTLGYKKVSNNPLKSNIESYNYAIESIFRMWLDDYLDNDLKIVDNNIDKLLENVENKLPDYIKKDIKKTKVKRK